MKEDSRNRKSSILMPVLMGSAVAAGMAFLLAPKTGKDLRKDMKRFSANARDQVAEVIDEGREVVAGAVTAGMKTYDAGTETIERLMHKRERSFMVPILMSGVIGAGIGLLLASRSGKEARADLKRIAVNARSKIVSAMDRGKVLYLKGK